MFGHGARHLLKLRVVIYKRLQGGHRGYTLRISTGNLSELRLTFMSVMDSSFC